METIILANIIVCILVGGVCVFVGLDLKKWSSWLLGLYGFVSGFAIGFIKGGLSVGLQVGILLAFAILFGGATTRWQRQKLK